MSEDAVSIQIKCPANSHTIWQRSINRAILLLNTNTHQITSINKKLHHEVDVYKVEFILGVCGYPCIWKLVAVAINWSQRSIIVHTKQKQKEKLPKHLLKFTFTEFFFFRAN